MTTINRQPRRSFPLWGQLAVVFLIIFLVPTITGAALFFSATQSIDRENIGAFIQQNGQRQRQVIGNVLLRASEDISSFASERETNRSMVGLLLADVQVNPSIPETTEEDAQQIILRELLDPATTLFEDVRIVNQRGVLLVAAGDFLPGEAVVGQDESNSAAFQQMQNERLGDPSVDQTIVVSRFAGGTIEYVNTIRINDTENVLGYVIATLNVEDVLIPTLTFSDDVYPAYAFLLSESGVVIAPEQFREQAELSRDSSAVDLAFQDQTGFDFYSIAGGTGAEVGGYYARLVGTPFVMLTQVDVNAVLGERQQYLTTILFPVLVGMVVLGAVLALFSRFLTEPLANLQRAMQSMGAGAFDAPVLAAERGDEIGDVARAFVDMRQQTQNLIEDLERRVARRTRDMEMTTEISRSAVTERDLQVLMDDVVKRIVSRFGNIYHAQIFLVDSDQRFAVLRASTGSVGRELLSRGHRLSVGSISVIGQVTAQGEGIIARDTAASQVHRANEFLPDTRAELAIPLRLGDEVIGALDVQSRESATFDDEQIGVLRAMADQLAIAIENTRLYEESVQRLRRIQERNRTDTRRVWQEYMYDNRKMQLVQQAGTPTDADLTALRQRALEAERAVVGDETARQTIPIAVPLRLRGEVIGAIAWELPTKEYDSNKVQLAQELAERLALSLDNTRLFEQSQRATERERLVNEISAKLTASTDVNRILQTAVREVGQALRSPQVSIRLSRNTADDNNPNSSDNGNQ